MILWEHNHPGAVCYADRPPLGGMQREAFIAALRERLRGRVHKAYIFGSFNTPRFGPESDVDLLLVCDCAEPFQERARRFEDLHDLNVPMDILVYRPEELAPLLAEPGGFWGSVRETLREL